MKFVNCIIYQLTIIQLTNYKQSSAIYIMIALDYYAFNFLSYRDLNLKTLPSLFIPSTIFSSLIFE